MLAVTFLGGRSLVAEGPIPHSRMRQLARFAPVRSSSDLERLHSACLSAFVRACVHARACVCFKNDAQQNRFKSAWSRITSDCIDSAYLSPSAENSDSCITFVARLLKV